MSTPESPDVPARNGFNGFLRALPGDRACLPPSPADMSCLSPVGRRNSANLTPASGRQDHATSPYATSSLVRMLLIAHRLVHPPCHPVARKTLPRPPHPHPASVTIAIRPSGGVGCPEEATDLGWRSTVAGRGRLARRAKHRSARDKLPSCPGRSAAFSRRCPRPRCYVFIRMWRHATVLPE